MSWAAGGAVCQSPFQRQSPAKALNDLVFLCCTHLILLISIHHYNPVLRQFLLFQFVFFFLIFIKWHENNKKKEIKRKKTCLRSFAFLLLYFPVMPKISQTKKKFKKIFLILRIFFFSISFLFLNWQQGKLFVTHSPTTSLFYLCVRVPVTRWKKKKYLKRNSKEIRNKKRNKISICCCKKLIAFPSFIAF